MHAHKTYVLKVYFKQVLFATMFALYPGHQLVTFITTFNALTRTESDKQF